MRWRLRRSEFNVVHRAEIRKQALEALSRFPTSREDNTPLEDNLPLFTLDKMQNLGDKHLREETTKGNVVPLDNNRTGMLVDTPPTETELLVERTQETYCVTATPQVSCQQPKFYLGRG